MWSDEPERRHLGGIEVPTGSGVRKMPGGKIDCAAAMSSVWCLTTGSPPGFQDCASGDLCYT
jgi:hypothetical protein